MNRFLIFFVLVVFGFGSVLIDALAYIPPSQFILDHVVKKRAGLKTVKVRATVSALTASGAVSSVKFIDETVYESATGTLKSLAFDEAGREIYSVERGLSKPENATELPVLISEILFEARAGQLFSVLQKWKIPIQPEEELLKLESEKARREAEKTFLVRKNSSGALKISWAIGEEFENQLWIEKDTFLPSRFLLKSDQEMDVEFDSFRVVKEIPVLQTLTVKKGAQGVLRYEAQEITVNAPIATDLSRVSVNGFTELGQTAEAELRDLVKRFYTTVR